MKTKRIQVILLCLLLAALLCACGEEPRSAAGPAESAAPTATPDAVVTLVEHFSPPEDFSREDSLAMANYLCANRALLSGEYLYTLDFDAALQPVLGRYRVVDGGLREFTVLVENCVAEYLIEDGDALYFINGGRAERLSLDSGERAVLCEDAHTLQLADGKLWYLNGEGQLCRMETDGSWQSVMFSEPCAYPYVLGELLLVQRGPSNALFLRPIVGRGEQRLTQGSGYAPLLVGRTLYFTEETESGKRLCRLELDGDASQVLSELPLRGTAEFFYDKGWQTRLAREGDLLRQSILPLDAGAEGADCAYSGYHLLDFVGPNLRVDAVYEADGRLNSFMLYTPDGGVLRYFGGKMVE